MDGYRLVCPIQVRFRDTDALGHVNNAVYLQYLEIARIEYLRKVLNVTRTSEFDVVVARVEIDYKSPLMPHESAEIGIRVESIGGASFTFEYRVEEKATGRLVASAKSVMVCFDFGLNKVKKIDEERRRKMEEYDGVA